VPTTESAEVVSTILLSDSASSSVQETNPAVGQKRKRCGKGFSSSATLDFIESDDE
jgi:hypothetical protein